jgi:hypothetical protein
MYSSRKALSLMIEETVICTATVHPRAIFSISLLVPRSQNPGRVRKSVLFAKY